MCFHYVFIMTSTSFYNLCPYHRQIVGTALYALAFSVFHGTVQQTLNSFGDPLKGLSHGWLIPFISIAFIWKRKTQLRDALKRYSAAGFLCAALSLVLYAWAGKVAVFGLRQLALIILLWSLAFATWGWSVAKILMFPFGYLIFTISVPEFIETLVIKLQNISSASVFYIMNGCCFEVCRFGNSLYSLTENSEFQLQIAGNCSGIQSLTALTALAAAFAWHSQKNAAGKWVLLLSAIPIAIVCNIFRVLSICLVASLFGQDMAIGYYHVYSGYVSASIGILLIFQCGNWLRVKLERKE